MMKGYDSYEKMEAIPEWRLITEAMRNAISEDLINLKICMYKRCNRCTLCGEVMEFSECDLDHYYPQFNAIALTYMKSRQYEISDIKLRQHWSTQDRWSMKFDDNTIEQDWITYHHNMSSFRLLHRKENAARYKMRTKKWLDYYNNIDVKADINLDDLMDIDFKIISEEKRKRIRELDVDIEALIKSSPKKVKGGVENKRGATKWSEHVAAYAKEHNLNYFQALKPAKETYVTYVGNSTPTTNPSEPTDVEPKPVTNEPAVLEAEA